jgi:hypothetical protein
MIRPNILERSSAMNSAMNRNNMWSSMPNIHAMSNSVPAQRPAMSGSFYQNDMGGSRPGFQLPSYQSQTSHMGFQARNLF